MGLIDFGFNVALTPVRVGTRIVKGVLGMRADAEPAPAPSAGAAGSGARGDASPKPWIDDVTLARKVETEIFRDPSVPKGKIDVNAAEGVVWLRGEARTPDMINELERLARAVPEVRRVENLLHLPKAPAPSRTDTPEPQRRTRRSQPATAERKVTTGRVSAERRVPDAEPSPAELAARGSGRRPAPLGSEDRPEGGARAGNGAPVGQAPADEDVVAREEAAAAAEAAAIGGTAPDPDDAGEEAWRAVEEGGGGESEGFELAEQALIDNAEHGGGGADPLGDAGAPEGESDLSGAEYAEADEVESTERLDDPQTRPDDPGAGPGQPSER